MGPLKIAIVVHGKFHAFGLACALAEQGHDVTVFTNCPRRFAGFNLPDQLKVCTNWAHQFRSRVWRFARRWLPVSEANLLGSFGMWAAGQLRGQRWDIIYAWSSVAKELLESPQVTATHKLVVRGSTHIVYQDRLLAEESDRIGCQGERPEPTTVKRELAEYEMADRIVVLSNFCKQSFIEEGIDPARIIVMIPGVNTARFLADEATLRQREMRVRSAQALRIVTIGTFCQRKGVFDYCQLVNQLERSKFQFRFVGSTSPDAVQLMRSIKERVEFVPRVEQSQLPKHLGWGDLFLFPTLEEGFPQSVLQAAACMLPVITTENGAGQDLFRIGAQGWLVPIRDPDATAALLRELFADRTAILERLAKIDVAPRAWSQAAEDLLQSLEGCNCS